MSERNKFATHYIIVSLLAMLPTVATAQRSTKLSGTVIGTTYSVDYGTGLQSTSVNTAACAFDGNLDTYFASYDRSRTWCGLDLGTKHIITSVRWSPRNDSNGPRRVKLCIFEGANEADFSDAVPLYMSTEEGVIGQYQQAKVNVSRGFRYVRYVGPNNARCNVAEVEFYGYEGEVDGSNSGTFYRPSNLPLITVHVENAQDPVDKVTNLSCTASLIPADPNDTVKIKTGTFRLRGNNSMSYDKKPYRIKFDKKHHVFNSPASAKKWVLINNYGDKTLMRNIIAFEISRRLGMEFTPFCQPVDVMVNGEYKGCYQLCDHIDVNKDRVDIEEMDNTMISGNDLTGGYLVEVDSYAASEDNYFYSTHGNPVTIKYPSSDDIATIQTTYIKNRFNSLEASLFSSTYMSASGYRRYLNLDSFLRHFIVGELSGNTDTYWSMNMYKHRGDDQFYVGPVWDFDLGFENDNRTYPINNHTDWVYTYGSSAGNMKNFVNRIIKSDEKAFEELKTIWQDARTSGKISAESLNAYVDEIADSLQESQTLNFKRWDILNSYVHQNWQACGSYDGEVEIVKNYITERIAWIDNKLGFDASGIDETNAVETINDNRIYSLDGRYLGTDIQALPKGIYIRNGRKLLIR